MRLHLLVLALGLGALPAWAGVPHLPEVREMLSPIQVKVNAGHYQDLRLGQKVALVRGERIVAYATVGSMGEDWSVLDIVLQRPDEVVSLGDQIRSLHEAYRHPVSAQAPLLQKTDPKTSSITRLMATDVDHGLETDLPLTTTWSHPGPSFVIPPPAVMPKTSNLPPFAPAPLHRDLVTASWVFELKNTTIHNVTRAIGELGYGQKILVKAHESGYPEDKGKVLLKVETTGSDLLTLVARVIQDVDKP